MNGSKAAFAQAVLSIASLAVGLAILGAIDSGGPAVLSPALGLAGLPRISLLLIATEGIKAASALCVLLVVRAVATMFGARPARLGLVVGAVGATLLLASAGAGAAVFLPGTPEQALSRGAGLLSIGSVALIGLWALLCGVAFVRTGHWLTGALGLIFGLASLPAYLSPLLALASFLAGLVWWIALGVRLVRSRAEPAQAD